jgi:hypothetical protein
MKRKAKQLRSKAGDMRVHEMRHRDWFAVESTSGNQYLVQRLADNRMTCNCKWATRGGKFNRGVSGCSHTLAVQAHIDEQYRGRKTYAHDGEEAARRQHRKTVHLGQGLYATSRLQ